MEMKAVPIYRGGAAEWHPVGRARATHAMERQRPIQPHDCRGPTASVCESGIRAPSRGRHAVPGQVIAGKAFGRHHQERIRPPPWWERNHGQRPRAPSRGTHPTVVAANRAAAKRPRTPYQVAPSRASTSGRSAHPFGVVPPNQRMQPDAVPATRSRRFYVVSSTQTPSRSTGAARLMRQAFSRIHGSRKPETFLIRSSCG
jgi:hypothetical protein